MRKYMYVKKTTLFITILAFSTLFSNEQTIADSTHYISANIVSQDDNLLEIAGSADSLDNNYSVNSIPEDSTLDTQDSSVELEIEISTGETVDSNESTDSIPPIEEMPVLIKTDSIDYPKEVYSKGIEGVVVINLIVDDSGRVDSVWLEKGIDSILDRNTMEAAKKFRFKPAIAGGEPVPVMIQYEKKFELKEIVSKVEKYVNFEGRVVERGTRNPVADAMIILDISDSSDTSVHVPINLYMERIESFDGQYIEDGKLVAITDSAGNFRFYSLPVCSLTVSIVAPGCEPFLDGERLTYGEKSSVLYRLVKKNYSEYEVVVYGKSEKKEVTKHKLSISEVKKIPGFGGDAVKVVQALPGVARPTFGSAQIIVRGAGTNDSKFLLDGIEIPKLFHFGGLKSTYNSDALSSVDFYPGGFGTRYGGAVAGIIEITGRKAKTDRFHGYVDANFFDGSTMVEGPVGKKVSVLGEFRRSFIGDIIKLVAKKYQGGNILTVAPSYWDYIFRADVDINNKNHAYFTMFGAKDVTEMVSSDVRGGSKDIDEAKDSFKMSDMFNMSIVGWDFTLSDKLRSTFRYSTLYGKSKFSAFGFFKQDMDYWTHTIREQFETKFSEKLKLVLGADAQFGPVNIMLNAINGTGTTNSSTLKNWNFSDIAGYVFLEWKPLEKLLLIPGIRYDYFAELKYDGSILPEFSDYNFDNQGKYSAEPSLRLNGRFEFIKNHVAKFAVGNYSETPQPMGFVIHPDWGNPYLPATKASQYVIGYEWQINDLISLSVEGYYNRQWDIPRSVTDTAVSVYKPDGKKRMKGLEFMLRHDQGKRFFGWLSYSLSRSEVYSYDENKWILFGKDQTHNLIAVGSWKLPHNWESGFKFQYTTGDPKTPVVGIKYYDENFHTYVTKSGAVNSSRLDPTAQLDIRVDRKFVFKKWILSTYIDFINIGYFWYKSPQSYVYNSDYPFDEVEGIPLRNPVNQFSIISLGIKGEF